MTQLSTPILYKYEYIETFKGFIYLPIEGEYRFEMLCDDACTVLQSSNVNNTSPSTLQTILSVKSWIPDMTNPYSRVDQNVTFTQVYNQSGYYYTEIYSANPIRQGYFKLSITMPEYAEVASSLHATPS